MAIYNRYHEKNSKEASRDGLEYVEGVELRVLGIAYAEDTDKEQR
jgi:hypothetical protein